MRNVVGCGFRWVDDFFQFHFGFRVSCLGFRVRHLRATVGVVVGGM